jgi:hypothetical protein
VYYLVSASLLWGSRKAQLCLAAWNLLNLPRAAAGGGWNALPFAWHAGAEHVECNSMLALLALLTCCCGLESMRKMPKRQDAPGSNVLLIWPASKGCQWSLHDLY